MRALIYKDKLQFDKDYPLEKRENEALIKITMAGICNTDLEIVKGYMALKEF